MKPRHLAKEKKKKGTPIHESHWKDHFRTSFLFGDTVVPGNASESLLFHAIKRSGDLAMPTTLSAPIVPARLL